MRGLSLALLIAIILPLCVPLVTGERSDEKPLIVVSLEPLASIVREVVLDRADVLVIVPEGVEPHTYQAPPEVLEAAKRADLFVTTAHLSVEEQVSEITEAPVIGLEDYKRHGLKLIPVPGRGGENIHGFWLDPDNALAIAKAVEEAMERIDPEEAQVYRAALANFERKIESLKKLIGSFSEERQLRAVKAVVAVPAEAYLVNALGMIPVNSLGIGPGTLIGASELMELGRAIERGEVTVIVVSELSEHLEPGQMAEELVAEHGGTLLRLRIMQKGSISYDALWTWNLGLIEAQMRSSCGASRSGWAVANCIVLSSLVVLAGMAVVLWKIS